MLFATLLHWDRFSDNISFTIWVILYIVTPFLIPGLWFLNRGADSGEPEPNDVIIASWIRMILKWIALASLIYAMAGFASPNLVINTWVWALTPLTARVLRGWITLLGVGSLSMSMEKRWSGWKVPLESIAIWHILVFVAAFMNPSDFTTGLVNWYTIAIGVMLLGIFIFYPMMEMQRSRK